jgi:hypothetical protein
MYVYIYVLLRFRCVVVSFCSSVVFVRLRSFFFVFMRVISKELLESDRSIISLKHIVILLLLLILIILTLNEYTGF